MQDYKIYRIGGWAKLGAVWTGLQDYKIYRINCVGLNWGLKMDRIAGFRD